VPAKPPDPAGRFEQSLSIAAPAAKVYACFFSPDALKAWWRTTNSVTTPANFGVYAVQWATTPYRDDILGPLGGVFHGTVVDARPGSQFLVADCWWIPPEGDAIGPMALHVTCVPEGTGCKLHIRQDGYDANPRWRRYYAIVSRGWQISLSALKRYAEENHL
jgi:uncharacterized protein YndB with AHSA1/START domain